MRDVDLNRSFFRDSIGSRHRLIETTWFSASKQRLENWLEWWRRLSDVGYEYIYGYKKSVDAKNSSEATTMNNGLSKTTTEEGAEQLVRSLLPKEMNDGCNKEQKKNGSK